MKLSLNILILFLPMALNAEVLDYDKKPIKYPTVKFINNSDIAVVVQWNESYTDAQGKIQKKILETVEPRTTKELHLGAKGVFMGRLGDFTPKIIYRPLAWLPEFKKEIRVDLSRSPAFMFETTTFSEILKNITVPILSVVGDDGKLQSRQYKGLEHPTHWETIITAIGGFMKVGIVTEVSDEN